MASKKIKIIKVENRLQQKVGSGQISEYLVEAADKLILENKFDFIEVATPALLRLQQAIYHIRNNQDDIAALSGLIEPVMELKANGAMFKYPLISDLSSIMLSFLEHIDTLDSDIIDILSAHEKTLSAIIGKRVKGDGGALGVQVKKELVDACDRYYRKNPLSFKTPAKNPKTPTA